MTMHSKDSNPAEEFFGGLKNNKPTPSGFFTMREHMEDQPTTELTPPQPLQKMNEFNAPIPGQSLTDNPGNAAWEHPPQFTHLDKALDYVYGQFFKKNNTKKLLTLLKNGVPAEAVARTVLFSGFSQGKWTPDLVLLMAKPVLAMVVAIGKGAGIKNIRIPIKKRGDEAAIMGAKLMLAGKSKMDLMPPEEPVEPLGIMERPTDG